MESNIPQEHQNPIAMQERKTITQILESHSMNHPGIDSEFTKETCTVMMQAYAEQEMAAVLEWVRENNFNPTFNKIWVGMQKPYTGERFTTQQLLTLYKESHVRKMDS